MVHGPWLVTQGGPAGALVAAAPPHLLFQIKPGASLATAGETSSQLLLPCESETQKSSGLEASLEEKCDGQLNDLRRNSNLLFTTCELLGTTSYVLLNIYQQ